MTTSGVYTFTLTNNEIVTQAFGKLGVGSEGEALTARMYSDGTAALNLLIKSWEAMDHLWTRSNYSLALIADTAAYALTLPTGGKPMRVISARRKTTASGYEIPMQAWSRQEYLDQPNKTSSPSTPLNFYYDPQRTTGTLYLWPAPSAAVAPTITIEIDYLRRMTDQVTSNNEADVPQEWLNALVWNLAVELMPQYPINDSNLAGMVIKRAEQLFADLKGWDNEPTSLYLQPNYQGWGPYQGGY